MDQPRSVPGPTSGLPFGLVLGLAVGWAGLALSRGALRDVDLYWHLLLGRQLAEDPFRPPPPLGGWELIARATDWESTQWLSEVLLHTLHTVGEWPALAAFRVVTAAIAIAILAGTTLRGRPLILAAWPFALTVLTLGVASMERAQQFTYIGAAVLSGVLLNGLQQDRLPRWWAALPATILWANLHGGWLLVPAVLVLVGLGRVVDHGLRDALALRSWGLALITIAAGAVSPAGISNVTAVARFADAASDYIIEWQHTQPFSRGGFVTLLMLLLVLISWTQGHRPPRSEVLVISILLVLSWTSWRNLAPAMVLMTPLVASQLVAAFPSLGRRPEPRWSPRLGMASAAGLLLVGLATLPGREHLPVDTYPVELASAVADLPGERRVLNEYNAAGITLFFGGDGIQVGIDGRTDYFGAEYIGAYLDMMHLQGDWEGLLEELDPDTALVRDDAAITHLLTEDRGWLAVGRESGYVLLKEPDPV